MILDRLDVDASAFEAATGWAIKPEGACKGVLCVPLPDEVRHDDGTLAVPALAERLRMPLVHDDEHQLWALGPASVSGKAIDTAEVPDLVLPDVEGNPFHLSSLHGKKVLLVAWASW